MLKEITGPKSGSSSAVMRVADAGRAIRWTRNSLALQGASRSVKDAQAARMAAASCRSMRTPVVPPA